MPVLADLLEHETQSVERHESLSRAAKRMYENHIGSVCVLDEAGELVGIFTERDLLRASAAGVDTHASTVGNWMTEQPMTAPATMPAATAMQTMLDRGFRHLPVTQDGMLIGVVSMRTLSSALLRERMG